MTAAHTAGVLEVEPDSKTYAVSVIARDSGGEIVIHCPGRRREANARRLALCWNALAGLDDDAVERLGVWLEGMNSDQVRDLLADEGF